MEVETYRIYPLDIPRGGGMWIDNYHLMLVDTMVCVPEMKVWRMERLLMASGTNTLDVLAGASHVLALEGRVYQGYEVVSIDPERPYYVDVRARDEAALAIQLGDIPYTIVPERDWKPYRDAGYSRLYSPDGKYFVSGGEYSSADDTYYPQKVDYGKMSQPPIIMFDAKTEKMVAMADKSGWAAGVLGWASDSSGVYLHFSPMGGDYGFAPAGFPTYKLLAPGQKPSGKKPVLVN